MKKLFFVVTILCLFPSFGQANVLNVPTISMTACNTILAVQNLTETHETPITGQVLSISVLNAANDTVYYTESNQSYYYIDLRNYAAGTYTVLVHTTQGFSQYEYIN